jgi:hypothetical protein
MQKAASGLKGYESASWRLSKPLTPGEPGIPLMPPFDLIPFADVPAEEHDPPVA